MLDKACCKSCSGAGAAEEETATSSSGGCAEDVYSNCYEFANEGMCNDDYGDFYVHERC